MKNTIAKAKIEILAAIVIAAAVVTATVAVLLHDAIGKKGSGLSSDFSYTLKDLAVVDPNIILYQEATAPIPTQLKRPHAIATDTAGRIYISGEGAINIFAPNANLLSTIKVDYKPLALAISRNGTLYVAANDHIQVFNSLGRRVAAWLPAGEGAVITSIAVYNNNVFVADAANKVVIRYDTNGKELNRIGQTDPEAGLPVFIIPSPYFDLAVTPGGLLAVVNPGRHRIESYTFAGELQFWWGKSSVAIEGFCGCCNPVNFAILPDGSFVTCEKGLLRVKVYNPEGQFVGVVATPHQLEESGPWQICDSPEQCREGAFDIAVDKDTRVLVLDTKKAVIRIFTTKKGAVR